MKKVLLYVSLLLTIIIVGFILKIRHDGCRLGINVSESLPQRIFIYKPIAGCSNLDKYQKIVFRLRQEVPKEYGFKKGDFFVKVVVGVPGDYIVQKEGSSGTVSTYINGTCVSAAYKKDRLGNTLSVFRFTGQIPNDEYFVTTTHPYSFDSRYFGFIKSSEVLGIVQKSYL